MKNPTRMPPSWAAPLREVFPEPSLPLGFARSVMHRIRQDEPAAWAWVRDMVLFVRKPASLGFLLATLMLGVWQGWREGTVTTLARAERAHVLAIDPESTTFLP